MTLSNRIVILYSKYSAVLDHLLVQQGLWDSLNFAHFDGQLEMVQLMGLLEF